MPPLRGSFYIAGRSQRSRAGLRTAVPPGLLPEGIADFRLPTLHCRPPQSRL